MPRPPCISHSREHTSEILNTATLPLSHSLSFLSLLLYLLSYLPSSLSFSTSDLQAPTINGLKVGEFVKSFDSPKVYGDTSIFDTVLVVFLLSIPSLTTLFLIHSLYLWPSITSYHWFHGRWVGKISRCCSYLVVW